MPGAEVVMRRPDSPRLWIAVALSAALAVGSMVAAQRSSSGMAAAASTFLGALSSEQRQKAAFAFDDTAERHHWHFIPTGPPPMFPRKGLTIKEMTQPQRALAHNLVKAGL